METYPGLWEQVIRLITDLTYLLGPLICPLSTMVLTRLYFVIGVKLRLLYGIYRGVCQLIHYNKIFPTLQTRGVLKVGTTAYWSLLYLHCIWSWSWPEHCGSQTRWSLGKRRWWCTVAMVGTEQASLPPWPCWCWTVTTELFAALKSCSRRSGWASVTASSW